MIMYLISSLGVYDIDQSRRILLAGKQIGLEINFHGDELNYTGSAEVSWSFCCLNFLIFLNRWVRKLVHELLVI
jgi:hypothetical protein